MTPSHIARKLTRQLNIKVGSISAEQVTAVANGTERTVSHPVIASIMSELRKQPKARQRGHKATNDSHLWEE